MNNTMDMINHKDVNTLPNIFLERVRRTPDLMAYQQYSRKHKQWQSYSWHQMREQAALWQKTLQNEGLKAGDKVALMVSNSIYWVLFDQACLGLGLVVVPIYTNDRPDNVGYILENAEIQLLLVETPSQLSSLKSIKPQIETLRHVVCINEPGNQNETFANVIHLDDWLVHESGSDFICVGTDSNALATIVYTSGTTGKPKGVMLSHNNIMSNLYSSITMVDVGTQDKLLSFLPLSHMLERTVGYYLPIASGSCVAFSRSIAMLANDLLEIKPTIMVSVPRIFERVFGKIQDKLLTESPLKQRLFNTAIKLGWQKFLYQQKQASWTPSLLFQPLLDKLVGAKVRDKLGGNLRFTVCGGAALSGKIAEFFIGLGVPLLQGYGLTETSPVISVNKISDNIPSSVGLPLSGVEVKVDQNDELLTKSDSVMLGYWKNDEATQAIMSEDGWLHTGDKAQIEQGHIFITGRIKDIIVLANGEKVPPSDMELAISLDNLIEQVMVVGEARAFLSALLVLNEDALARFCMENDLDANSDDILQNKTLTSHLLSIIKNALHDFPGYAKIRRISVCPEAWSIDNGMMTPTLKIKRAVVETAYAAEIDAMYEGHS